MPSTEIDPRLQIVLCAGEADTKEMQAEMEARISALQAVRPNLVYIGGMIERSAVIALYSHATVFCCPSIYEPFGIINLEAMACATPVVGSAVGGIAEVVVDGETGFLVDAGLRPEPPHDPIDPQAGSPGAWRYRDQPVRRRTHRWPHAWAPPGAKRVVDHYSWDSIASRTLSLYQRLVDDRSNSRTSRVRNDGPI